MTQVNTDYPSGVQYSGCKLGRNGALTIAKNTTTDVSWDSEFWDTDNYHDLVVNPTRITIPSAGRYFFHAQMMSSSQAQDGYVQLRVLKNGSELIHGGRWSYGASTGPAVNPVNPFKMEVIGEQTLAAGDIITIEAFTTDNGSNTSCVFNVGSTAYCFVEVQKLS